MNTRAPFVRRLAGTPQPLPPAATAEPLPPDSGDDPSKEVVRASPVSLGSQVETVVASLGHRHQAADAYVAFDTFNGTAQTVVVTGRLYGITGGVRALIDIGQVRVRGAGIVVLEKGIKIVSARMACEKYELSLTYSAPLATSARAYVGLVGSDTCSIVDNPRSSLVGGVAASAGIFQDYGRVSLVRAMNDTGGAQFLQIFDKSAAPVLGDVALDEFLVPAGQMVSWDYRSVQGRELEVYAGFAYGWSTTSTTFTAGAAAPVAFEYAGGV